MTRSLLVIGLFVSGLGLAETFIGDKNTSMGNRPPSYGQASGSVNPYYPPPLYNHDWPRGYGGGHPRSPSYPSSSSSGSYSRDRGDYRRDYGGGSQSSGISGSAMDPSLVRSRIYSPNYHFGGGATTPLSSTGTFGGRSTVEGMRKQSKSDQSTTSQKTEKVRSITYTCIITKTPKSYSEKYPQTKTANVDVYLEDKDGKPTLIRIDEFYRMITLDEAGKGQWVLHGSHRNTYCDFEFTGKEKPENNFKATTKWSDDWGNHHVVKECSVEEVSAAPNKGEDKKEASVDIKTTP